MIELVLVYCMVADPTRCMEQRPVFEDPLTPVSCMMTAQKVAVDYVNEHPQWQFSRWRCEIDKPKSAPT
ncbi:MAG TPA: hypothetical protein VKS60_06495 [Stellaceae bacterium]|nr:hypothetical protein [Stellaceae bacterium]